MANKPGIRWSLGLMFCLALVMTLPGCILFHRHNNLGEIANPSDQPDRILYQRAVEDIRHGRYDVGRLTLQTLINTYPDSEYLSKAKLAIANSYYDQGGVSGLTEAEAEYKDFITFFPTAPEAPEAQFRVGMSHFRMMSKADRDQTEAKLAEIEFKEFLKRYPNNPLMPLVKARLREVQEVLAEGDYEVAQFYYMRHANLAAKSRFEEIVQKYPNFSRGDKALWYLGQTYERLKKPNQALPYYAEIVELFPLSPLVKDAKEKLRAANQPIPHPSRAVLARAEADALHHAHHSVLGRLVMVMSSAPDTSHTRYGPVRLGPLPSNVELAKQGGERPAKGANKIAVQQASDASLKSGKAVDPTPSKEKNKTEAEKNHNGKSESASEDRADSAAPASSEKKKEGGPLHTLMKVIKPF